MANTQEGGCTNPCPHCSDANKAGGFWYRRWFKLAKPTSYPPHPYAVVSHISQEPIWRCGHDCRDKNCDGCKVVGWRQPMTSTNTPQPTEADLLPITQAIREAAALCAEDFKHPLTAAEFREGKRDWDVTPQAFARHAQQAREEERERCIAIVRRKVGNHWDRVETIEALKDQAE